MSNGNGLKKEAIRLLCRTVGKTIVYFIALFVIILVLSCIYKIDIRGVLLSFEDRVKEGSSIGIAGFEIGESKYKPEVRVEHAIRPLNKYDVLVDKHLITPSILFEPRKFYPRQLEGVNTILYDEITKINNIYNVIVEECVYGSPFDQEKNEEIFNKIKKFYNEQFIPFKSKIFIKDTFDFKDRYKCECEDERECNSLINTKKDEYYVLQYIAGLHAIFERENMRIERMKTEQREQNEQSQETVMEREYQLLLKNGEKFAEKIYNKMFKEYKPYVQPEDYCNRVYYDCWTKVDDRGKLEEGTYEDAKKYISEAEEKLRSKTLNTDYRTRLLKLIDKVYLGHCEAYLETLHDKLFRAIDKLQSTNGIITKELSGCKPKELAKMKKEEKEKKNNQINLFKELGESLFYNQLYISLLYYNCILLPQNNRVQKSIDSLSELFGAWDHHKERHRYEIFFWNGFYNENIGKYQNAIRNYKNALKHCKRKPSRKESKDGSSLITVGNIPDWDALLHEIQGDTKNLTKKLLTSKLKESNQLEKFKTICVNQLTDEMKEGIVAAFNAIKDNLTFYKDEVAGKGIKLSPEVQKELNNLKEILEESGELKKGECDLSDSQKEDIKWFNIAILKNLFPHILSKSPKDVPLPQIEIKKINSKKAKVLACLCRIMLINVKKAFYNKEYDKFEYDLSVLGGFFEELKIVLKKATNNQREDYKIVVDDLGSIIEIAKGCAELKKYELHPSLEKSRLSEAKYLLKKIIKRRWPQKKISNNHKFAKTSNNKYYENLSIKAKRWLGYTYLLEAKYYKDKSAIDEAVKYLESAGLQLDNTNENLINRLEINGSTKENLEKCLEGTGNTKEDFEGYLKEMKAKLKQVFQEINSKGLKDLKKKLDELRNIYIMRFPDDLEIYHLLCDVHMLRFKYKREKLDKDRAQKYLDKYEKCINLLQTINQIVDDAELHYRYLK